MNWNKIEIVQNMQDYIKDNIFNDEFNLKEMYHKIGYSKRHCERIFKEFIGMTPLEYVRSILISNSSSEIIKTNKTILEIALKSKFDTHEGYTRAFKKVLWPISKRI